MSESPLGLELRRYR